MHIPVQHGGTRWRERQRKRAMEGGKRGREKKSKERERGAREQDVEREGRRGRACIVDPVPMIEGGRRPDHAMSAAFLTMPSLRGSRERNEVVEARLWDAGALRVCRAQERPAGASHVVHNRECVAGYEVWDDSPRHSLGCRRCSWFC